MHTIATAALSLAVLAAFVLAGGGLFLIFRKRNTRQGLLMLLSALVLLGNVLIWTVPI